MQPKQNKDFAYIMNEEETEEEDPELVSCWRSDLLHSPSSSTTRPKSRAQLTPGPIFEDEKSSTRNNGIRLNLNTSSNSDSFVPTPVKGNQDSKRRHLTPGHHSVSSSTSNSSTPTNGTRASPNNFMRFGLTLDNTKKKPFSPHWGTSADKFKIPKSPPMSLRTTFSPNRFSPSINMLDPSSEEYVPKSYHRMEGGHAHKLQDSNNMMIKTTTLISSNNDSETIDSPKLPSFHQPPAPGPVPTSQQNHQTKPRFNDGKGNSLNALSNKSLNDMNVRHAKPYVSNHLSNEPPVGSALSHLLNNDQGRFVSNQKNKVSFNAATIPPSTSQPQTRESLMQPSFQNNQKMTSQVSKNSNSGHDIESNLFKDKSHSSYNMSGLNQYSSSYPPSPQVNAKQKKEKKNKASMIGLEGYDAATFEPSFNPTGSKSKGGINIPRPTAVDKKSKGTKSAKHQPAVVVLSSSPLQKNPQPSTSSNMSNKISFIQDRQHSGTEEGFDQVLNIRETLVETPISKIAFKDFCRKFRALEKEKLGGYQAAWQFAEQCLSEELVPDKVHWRVYLELAERARKENLWSKASHLYSASCELQPFAAAGWLDWAKLEEERGRLKASCEILKIGLIFCEVSESLVTRRIKLEEKLYNNYVSKQLFQKSTAILNDFKDSDQDCNGKKMDKTSLLSSTMHISRRAYQEEQEQDQSLALKTMPGLRVAKLQLALKDLGGEHSDEQECGLIAKFKEMLINGKDTFGVLEERPRSSGRDGVHRSLTNLFDDQVNESSKLSEGGLTLNRHTESHHPHTFVLKKDSTKQTEGENEDDDEAFPMTYGRSHHLNRLESVRHLLGKLAKEPIEKVWRAVLEGALLEARNGEVSNARIILQFLIQQVPWYGPVHYEYFRMEEKCENWSEASSIMANGLKEVPRYGPLWFGKLRVAEVMDIYDWKLSIQAYNKNVRNSNKHMLRKGSSSANQKSPLNPPPPPPFHPTLSRTRQAIEEAKNSITKELVWKVHFEAAAVEERAAWLCHEQVVKHVKYEHRVYEAKQTVILELNRLIAQVSFYSRGSSDDGDGASGNQISLPKHQDNFLKSLKKENSSQLFDFKLDDDALAFMKQSDGLDLARDALANSARTCPQNLQWKVWLAGGRMELSSPDLSPAFLHDHIYDSSYNCQDTNSRYQIEKNNAKAKALHRARLLFKQAYQTVPEKSKAQVMLECARLEEYANPQNPREARHILQKACLEARNEWKVFLESVMVEVRSKNWIAASETAIQALKVHSGTGRLWAVLIQLRGRPETWDKNLLSESKSYYQSHDLPPIEVMAPFASALDSYTDCSSGSSCNNSSGSSSSTNKRHFQEGWDFSWAQHFTLKQALDEVPKSGEVWCESGRLHLNPLNRYFDIELAQRHLDFAINFTPQYGDSFIEQLRLNLIIEHILPLTTNLINGKLIQINALVEIYMKNEKENKTFLNDDSIPKENRKSLLIPFLVKLCQEIGVFSDDCLRVEYSDIMDTIQQSPSLCESCDSNNDFFLRENPTKVFRRACDKKAEEDKNVSNTCTKSNETTSNHLTNSDLLFGKLEQTCTNADPNYGLMWFHCRERPGDSPNLVLRRAKAWIMKEMKVQAPLYLQSICRRKLTEYALFTVCKAMQYRTKSKEGTAFSSIQFTSLGESSSDYLWGNLLEASLRTVKAIDPLSLGMSPNHHQNDYSTGFVSLNRTFLEVQSLSDECRRKFLFGSDQIIP